MRLFCETDKLFCKIHNEEKIEIVRSNDPGPTHEKMYSPLAVSSPRRRGSIDRLKTADYENEV